jgi:hypothetical protein
MPDWDDLLRVGDDDGPRVRTFIAAYESDCANCGHRIFEGEEAGYIGDDTEASCARCLP